MHSSHSHTSIELNTVELNSSGLFRFSLKTTVTVQFYLVKKHTYQLHILLTHPQSANFSPYINEKDTSSQSKNTLKSCKIPNDVLP